MSLDGNEVSFEEEQDVSNTGKKSRKSKGVTKCCRCRIWGVMHTNVEYLTCGEVEGLDTFNYRIWDTMIEM